MLLFVGLFSAFLPCGREKFYEMTSVLGIWPVSFMSQQSQKHSDDHISKKRFMEEPQKSHRTFITIDTKRPRFSSLLNQAIKQAIKHAATSLSNTQVIFSVMQTTTTSMLYYTQNTSFPIILSFLSTNTQQSQHT